MKSAIFFKNFILAILWLSSLIMMLGTLERLDLYSLVGLIFFVGATYIVKQSHF